jgi:tetratricopeptide (TPR) repeat protein/predicted aspartyl protease
MVSCTLLAAGMLALHTGQAACAIKVMELPVTMVGTRAIATLGLNGTRVPLMVDSGAFFSFLTEAAAAQLKLRLHPMPRGMEVEGLLGKIVTHATTVEHLDLLKGQLSEVDFVVGGNEPGAGAMGLIGRNILSFTDTEYDLAHGVIRFVFPNDDCEKSNMAYWAGDTPVTEIDLLHEYRARTPAIRAEIQLNGKTVTALFDTGATTSVSLRAAHRAGIKDADMKPSGKIYGGSSETADAWTAAFARIDLGGEAVLNNRLEVADFELHEADVLVGIDFFLSHRIYVSKKQSKMYFTYDGGPVFALNKGDRAGPTVSAAAPADGMSADAHARRGAASLARGDLAAALADLDNACTLEPGTANFFTTRASVHAAMKQGDAARADLDTALRLDPAQADARIERAWMRFGAGERQPALDDLSVLDKTLPAPSQIRQSMAELYGTLEMPAPTLAQWNLWIPAHRHEITLASAFNSRCWARVELGIELDKALDDCDDAIDADSKNPSYLDSRAWVYLRLGKLQKSLADFDRGLALRPTGSWSLYGRGLVHLRLGETVPGQADLASARKQEPDIDAAIRRAGLPVAPAP